MSPRPVNEVSPRSLGPGLTVIVPGEERREEGLKMRFLQMTRFSLVVAVVAIGLTALPPSRASHDNVTVDVAIARDGTAFLSYMETVACQDTFCHVDVNFTPLGPDHKPGRDFARFERWCQSTAVNITVPAGDSSAFGSCAGPGHWESQISVQLQDLGFDPAPHSDVVVAVHAHAP